ncbi:MAG TPA: hypothetical protein VK507_24280, partial [Iamia sp.]|nr:hypothetical protein [Iamia sp.]
RAVTWGEVAGDTVSLGVSLAFLAAGGRNHLSLAGRSSTNFSRYVAGRFGTSPAEQAAARLFLRDFTQTVTIPHLQRHAAEEVGQTVVSNRIDDLTGGWAERSPAAEIRDRGPDVDELVDDALDEEGVR